MNSPLTPSIASHLDLEQTASDSAPNSDRPHDTTPDISFPESDWIIHHSQCLLNSFQHWVGRSLWTVSGSPLEQAQQLFEAPFPVVSHNTADDPIFNYGNRKALMQFNYPWEAFIEIPSRCVAPPVEQAERSQFLARSRAQGWSQNYCGTRFDRLGNSFVFHNCILWNVLDESGQYRGQAALLEL